MKSFYLIAIIFFSFNSEILKSQDLLGELNNLTEVKDTNKIKYTINTFSATRLINSQTTKMLAPGSLVFSVQHRFGSASGGINQLFGLDAANVRFSFSYGITKKLMIGLGRDKFENTYDGIIKWRMFTQSNVFPVNIVWMSSMALRGLQSSELSKNVQRRFAYNHQLIISKKFNKHFSLQVAPGISHKNYVNSNDKKNLFFNLGLGFRARISQTIYIVGDYTALLNKDDESLNNPIALGMEIVTGGGHFFQIHFTNTQAMNENGVIRSTYSDFLSSDIRFGFNILRVFSL